MYHAGWPDPTAMCGTGHENIEARANWQLVVEELAEHYLNSTALRVDTLIQLGPLARTNVTQALDIAGWEPHEPEE